MNNKRELVPLVLMIAAGVAAAAGLGAWVYLKGATIYSNLALLAAIVCAGIAAYLNPEPLQAMIGTRQAQAGGNVLAMSILLAAILLIVNMIFNPAFPRPAWLNWLPTFEKQWDLTASQSHSLSQETIAILKTVREPVEMLAFYSAQSSGLRSEDRLLLENYTRHSTLVKLQWIDPLAQPMLAQKYGVAYDGSVIFQLGERRQAANSVTEVGLTSALLKVLRARQPVVYFSSGHGERDPEDFSQEGYSQVKSALESSGYQVRSLTMAVTNTIPSDASAVIVAGPRQSFAANEADMLAAYLARGGKAMLMLDMVNAQEQPDTLLNLGKLLEDWGATVRNDLVVDAQQSLVNNLERVYIAPAVARYGYSSITDKLDGQVTVFMATRSITQTRKIEGLQYVALAQSSAESWGVSELAEVETALSEHRAPQPGAQDARGPLTLAASLENTQTGGRLVIFGSSAFASNTWVNATAGRELFLNAANWLSAQGEEEFSLPPRDTVVRQMQPLTLDKLIVAALLSVCLLPLGVAAAGVWVWWKRR